MTYHLDNIGVISLYYKPLNKVSLEWISQPCYIFQSGTSGGEAITFTSSPDLLFGIYVSNPNLFNNSDAYYNFYNYNCCSTGSSASWLNSSG